MAFSGRCMGGMGGDTFWHQQRSLRYLQDGKPAIQRTLARIWRYLRPYQMKLALGTLLMLLGGGMTLTFRGRFLVSQPEW